MQEAHYWMMEFWTGLSLRDLIGGSVLGTVIGLLLGIGVWLAMRRRGWLARRNRWHHAAIATHVVMLPLLFCFTGLQLGFTAGAQRALYKQIDHFQPHLQTLVASWMVDFERSLDDPALATLMRSDATVHQVTRQVVDEYLAAHPLPGADYLQGEGTIKRWTRAGVGHVRSALMSQWVEDSLSKEAAGYSGVDKRVFREALGMRMNELLHTQGAIRLLKAQLTSMMPGLYLGLLLPLLLIMAGVLLEIGLATRYGWRRMAATGNRGVMVDARGR
ncbi:hypothetical protein [Stenotrophomonas sp.]|uniref:hypothetical protein n=1 Tax=Stenotrophomonas sp. TaxID=69392 RepID=UPI002FC6C6C6